jgi:hypothetical protein
LIGLAKINSAVPCSKSRNSAPLIDIAMNSTMNCATIIGALR